MLKTYHEIGKQIKNSFTKHLPFVGIKSIGIVGNYLTQKELTPNSDVDFCLFMEKKSDLLAVQQKIKIIYHEIKSIKKIPDKKTLLHNSNQLWIDYSHFQGRKQKKEHIPINTLELGGWHGLASSYLNLYKKKYGFTIYGDKKLEKIQVKEEKIPQYEGYELFTLIKTEMAKGLGSNNQQKIARSILQAAVASLIAIKGNKTDNDQETLKSFSFFYHDSEGKKTIEKAYQIICLKKDRAFEIKEVISFFYGIEKKISLLYWEQLRHSPLRTQREELLYRYKEKIAPELAKNLCHPNLWSDIKPFYLFFDYLHQYLAKKNPLDLFTTNALKKYIVSAAVYQEKKINLKKIAAYDQSELDYLIMALLYNKEEEKKAISLRNAILNSAEKNPFVQIRTFSKLASDYDQIGDFNEAIKYWKLLQFEIEKIKKEYDIFLLLKKLGPLPQESEVKKSETLYSFIVENSLDQFEEKLALTYAKIGKFDESIKILLSCIVKHGGQWKKGTEKYFEILLHILSWENFCLESKSLYQEIQRITPFFPEKNIPFTTF